MADRSVLQQLYDSEINWRIATFWDAGFEWELGDEANGFKESGTGNTFSEAEQALGEAAARHYPDSVFARSREELLRLRGVVS